MLRKLPAEVGENFMQSLDYLGIGRGAGLRVVSLCSGSEVQECPADRVYGADSGQRPCFPTLARNHLAGRLRFLITSPILALGALFF
eukprot:2753561-Alexandrium_andersonii.AAC.1